MGRTLTDEEMRELEAKRRETMRITAEKLGMTVEELKGAEEEAREELARKAEKSVMLRRKVAARNALKRAYQMAETREAEKENKFSESMNDPDIIEAYTTAEFTDVLADKLAILKGNNRDSAVKTILHMIEKADGSSYLSIRYEMLLTLDSMIKSQAWREKTEKETKG